MLLFPIVALFTLIEAYDFDKLLNDARLVQEPWFPSGDALRSINYTGITPQCQKDVSHWQKDLLKLIEDVGICLADNGKLCTDQRKKDLMKNIYALKQIDAFGRLPSGFLELKSMSYGDPQECKSVSDHYIYKTRFCFLKSNIGQECSAPHNASAYWKTSVCMPASCSEEDMTDILSQLRIFDMGGLLHPCSTTCVHDEPDTDAFTWVFTGILGTIILLCLVGSVIDYLLENVIQKKLKHTGIQALTAFSLFSNGSQILDTRPPRDGHLRSLDCIRFLSMCWVASGHMMMYYSLGDSLLPLLHIPKPILNDTLINAFFSVDTFFVLSGLLVSYMFFRMKAKNPRMARSPYTWILFYVHRYLRLTPPMMLFIGFYIFAVPLFTGVLSTLLDYQATVGPCRRLWWQNLIYINNFQDNLTGCYTITWYLACDTQMYIFAPILLVILMFSHRLGLLSVVLICAGSTAACMAVIITQNLPATPVMDIGTRFLDAVYNYPWFRCPPYVLGMYTGYFLAKFGNMRLRVNKTQIFLGWVLAISIALACVYGPHDYLAREQKWSELVCALYYSLSRIGWGLFICWVIVANHFGWAGPISSFMCHPLWQPLGRLSYTAYLVHMFVIYYFWNLFDTPIHFASVWELLISSLLPVIVMAYIFAFFWSCLCELPFMKLEKMMIDGIMKLGKERQKAVKEEAPVKENWDEEEIEEQKNGTEKMHDDIKL